MMKPQFGIKSGEKVQVWKVGLDSRPQFQASLFKILALEEQERAERFLLPELRARFIIARARLRQILGEYLKRPPESLEFTYGEHGKPALVDESLCFNLSHKKDLALVAVAHGAVGVDVEFLNRKSAAAISREKVARRFFAAEEIAQLLAFPEEQQDRAFLEVWTRKEAYLKAHGAGISVVLDSFAVTAGEVARLLRDDADPTASERWTLRELAVGSEFVAAVCAEGGGWEVTICEYVADPQSK